MDIEQVIAKYVELRDRLAEMGKKHEAEMAPLNEAKNSIENYLMHQMNTLGVDSFKTGAGTAFKKNANSVQMQDPIAFKNFVFKPVADGVINYLSSAGYTIREIDHGTIANIIRDLPMWDMIDFRAGKKGITEYIENESKAVPGVAVNTIAIINIRRA